MKITHIGGPTTLIEIGGVRLLTDPTFDEPGRRYSFGFGTSSVKTAGPAVPAESLGPVDAVLLTHDHHSDNLDDTGRALLPSAPVVLTTVSGARRLGGNAVGLAPWRTATIGDVEVTATPARHGPPLSRALVGEAIGFALRPPGATSVIWISGDTVLFSGVRQVASRLTVDTAVLHLGSVQFGLTGPLRYTMTGRDAARLVTLIRPRRVVPVHYEGWSHFHEGRPEIEAAFPPGTLTWLTPGEPTTV
ncbi:MBL fold metallo-hydrolase [Actinoplanes philippinensis]|uniref:L-ascorbate metabolism protein UlaG, beta-lactamase superfamily n=1 Tax=Actinoplanes philippinensis TaxID=35752 RepID=A0A1I2J0Z6_9ACTN|nr:MBL fold metallo-hydrolase [Actinoplanes philippinensis]GIE79845.1 MBL fold metallo-hydrolase [Actinoplanes philippinensis]SFF46937.1 L-ascorbate metabolism protein UlaG, beta-lactamase superfamily [Actinoplanes philippinensis]